jgi:hypothetical protein
MMRVPFKASLARSGARACGLAAVAVVLAACSSAPIDAPNADGSDAAGSGATPGSGATSGSGATPSAGGGTTSVATAPGYQKVEYPPGPYGVGVDATLENFGFMGWRDPVAAGYDETKLEQIHLAEFYNPNGRTNTKLIWINASAVWCSVCRTEMADIRDNQVHASFGPRGVQMIVTLFEDKNSGPARPLDLHNWGSTKPGFSLDFTLLLDPGFKLGSFFTSDATPLNMLVDAKTMRVIDAQMGYSADYWQRVDAFLAKIP